MPAYNAAETLLKTYKEIPMDIVDDVILVDDASSDNTAQLAREIGISEVLVHQHNTGYGGNQKSCYQKALDLEADIIIMLHPDYQYTPKLIPAIAGVLRTDLYDAVLASRILGNGALEGGMPLYKYIANRFLTATQNLLMGQKLSEYHTGYRAFTREVLESIAMEENSDDFVFDNQMIAQIFHSGFKIAEVSCPTKYFPEASSINFQRSVKYGLGVLKVSFQVFLQRFGLWKFDYLSKSSRKKSNS